MFGIWNFRGESPPTHPPAQNGVLSNSTHENNRKSGSRWAESSAPYQHYQYFAQFNRIRKTFDRGPEVSLLVHLVSLRDAIVY